MCLGSLCQLSGLQALCWQFPGPEQGRLLMPCATTCFQSCQQGQQISTQQGGCSLQWALAYPGAAR